MADMREVLQRRIDIAIALIDDRLALIVVEEDLVLQRAGVLGADDLHRLFAQRLVFRQLARPDDCAGDALDLFHAASFSNGARPKHRTRGRLHRSTARRGAGPQKRRFPGIAGQLRGRLELLARLAEPPGPEQKVAPRRRQRCVIAKSRLVRNFVEQP